VWGHTYTMLTSSTRNPSQCLVAKKLGGNTDIGVDFLSVVAIMIVVEDTKPFLTFLEDCENE